MQRRQRASSTAERSYTRSDICVLGTVSSTKLSLSSPNRGPSREVMHRARGVYPGAPCGHPRP